MTIDAKNTLQRLEAFKKSKKGKTSFFIDLEIYRSFKAVCGQKKLSVSVVVEDLMKQFLESLKKTK